MVQSDLVFTYYAAVQETLRNVWEHEAVKIRQASQLVADVIGGDGLLYVFGTGHSHILAEEGFYRAGGLAAVSPIFDPELMLHLGAENSTAKERVSGIAVNILKRYPITSRDCLLVASNSGSNAVPVEMAQAAASFGVPVVAITSLSYSRSIQASRPKLYEVANIVIDNHCPPGDALVQLGDGLPRMGPASTIVGAFILHAICIGAAEILLDRGKTPDVYISSNLPGAIVHNQEVAKRMRNRIMHI